MSREALKSYLLVLMVGLSLVLSGYLVLGTTNVYPPIETSFENVYVGRVPDMNDLIIPWQTVITSPEEDRFLTPNDSYYFLVQNLLDSLSFEGYRINWVMDKLELEELNKEGVFLNYGHGEDRVDINLASNSLDTDFLPYPEIHAIHFNAEDNRVTVFNYELNTMWSQRASFDVSYIEQLVDESIRQDTTVGSPLPLDRADGIVFVPTERQEMLELRVSTKETDSYALKKSFFPTLTAREIQEKDGSTIITDGISGLRIYPDNVYEYTSAKEVAGPVYLPADQNLENAVDFVAKHGGWPSRNSFLRRVNKIDPYYSQVSFEFSYYEYGYPIVAEQSSIEITLQGGEVTRYYRNTVSPINLKFDSVNRNIINYLFALNIAEKEEIGKVRKMYLAYYLESENNDALEPVWVIKGQNKNIYIQGYTGDIIEVAPAQGGDH
ncbi:two-component system activity regulator YycH [Proteinivorax tanatarense]|uniref:Two-component system activity regulator YycH n=1 Tax=Proteinivorax tanatarense TaxID=1260629 RepID=A0AAU7VLE4_9FIRM